jgi:hypothetical protein
MRLRDDALDFAEALARAAEFLNGRRLRGVAAACISSIIFRGPPSAAYWRSFIDRFIAEHPLAQPVRSGRLGVFSFGVSFQDVSNFKVTRLPGLSSTRNADVCCDSFNNFASPYGVESVTTN